MEWGCVVAGWDNGGDPDGRKHKDAQDPGETAGSDRQVRSPCLAVTWKVLSDFTLLNPLIMTCCWARVPVDLSAIKVLLYCIVTNVVNGRLVAQNILHASGNLENTPFLQKKIQIAEHMSMHDIFQVVGQHRTVIKCPFIMATPISTSNQIDKQKYLKRYNTKHFFTESIQFAVASSDCYTCNYFYQNVCWQGRFGERDQHGWGCSDGKCLPGSPSEQGLPSEEVCHQRCQPLPHTCILTNFLLFLKFRFSFETLLSSL